MKRRCNSALALSLKLKCFRWWGWNDKPVSPELKRDQKNPSLITSFLKRLSRAIFFKGTHVFCSFPVEINHFTDSPVICMNGKPNSQGYLHCGAIFTHKNVIKENWKWSLRSGRQRAWRKRSTVSGGITVGIPHSPKHCEVVEQKET